MKIDCLVVGAFEVNCFVLSGVDGKALVIDPGCDAGRILDFLNAHGLTPAAYLLTHGHCDHVSALAQLCGLLPAPAGLHPQDRSWAFTPANAMPPFYPPPAAPATLDRAYSDGQEWEDAGLRYRVLETPGHTPGSVCVHFPEQGILFSGDTLFAGSVGRTDLPGGNSRLLRSSLRRLAGLPDSTRVYAGHGPETTLSDEKRTNYFMQNL